MRAGRHRRKSWLGSVQRWYVGYSLAVLSYYGFADENWQALRRELEVELHDPVYTPAIRRALRSELVKFDRGHFDGCDPIEALVRDHNL